MLTWRPRRTFAAGLSVVIFALFMYILLFLVPTGNPVYAIDLLALALALIAGLLTAFGYGKKNEKKEDRYRLPEGAD